LPNNETLTKTGSNGWSDGGSYSTSSISGNGFVSAQLGNLSKNLVFGLLVLLIRILVNLAPLLKNAVSKCKASVVLVAEV
jgi:hypothetical protein